MKLPSFLSLFMWMCCFSLCRLTEAIWLTLPPLGTKCVAEELHTNVVVFADYVVVSNDHSHLPTISVKKKNATHGQFAFTSQEVGNYLACFWVDGPRNSQAAMGDVSINLDWKTGIGEKDLESVAKKEKIQGVEMELKKLAGAVEAIHENLVYLKGKESEMRIVSEKTNARVAWFSIMSLAVCIAVSILQLWHLKRFFQKRKLI
ncbi:Transmembrane emp24 domain-containing protein p24delta4 [Linum grandiflorum]